FGQGRRYVAGSRVTGGQGAIGLSWGRKLATYFPWRAAPPHGILPVGGGRFPASPGKQPGLQVRVLGGEPVEPGVEDEGLAAGGVVGLHLAEEQHVVAGVDALGPAADEGRDGAVEQGE